MKHLKLLTPIVAIFAISFVFYFKKNKEPVKSSMQITTKGEISNFALLDHRGKFQELYRNSDSEVIVIISQGNDCPIIQKYIRTINDLYEKFKDKKVAFFLLNSSLHDNRDSIIAEATSYGLKIPILLDPSQVVAETLGITRTSEAVVIDTDGWKMVYRGSISDQLDYGVDKQQAKNNYLENSITSVLNGTENKLSAMPSKGCLITFGKSDLSYAKSIAPIIENKCMNCHSENGKFLPYFTDYKKFKNWSAMSLETILNTRMPPSSLDTYYGNFHNELGLSNKEKAALVRWIRADMPNDSDVDPLLSVAFKKNSNSKINPFTNVYETSMSEPHPIPPGGEIEYQYKQLGGPLPYDLYIKAVRVTPTNPRLIHHMGIIAVSKPLEFYQDYEKKYFPVEKLLRGLNKDGTVPLFTRAAITKLETNEASDMPRVQVFAGGKPQPFYMAKNTYLPFKKGSYLILEAHYMGSGKPETDLTKIEFYGTRKKIPGERLLRTKALLTKKISIPPGAKDYELRTPKWVPTTNILLYGFMGHLHMRGKAIEVVSTNKQGKTRTILSIPNYYYGWQVGTNVTTKEPIPIKAGEESLQVVCHYDNSPQNPNNPDASKTVRFGQRHDTTEMCLFQINYTLENE